MSKKNTLLTFKGICMNFLLELRFFILSHPVTSKQPHKIVQIHMGHPVCKVSVQLLVYLSIYFFCLPSAVFLTRYLLFHKKLSSHLVHGHPFYLHSSNSKQFLSPACA